MILLIDNYDSFSYNLYQLIGSFRPDITVIRNDQCSVSEIMEMKPEAIFLSPGPGRPEQAGICISLVKEAAGTVPFFGVCLGHQAIYEAFGGVVAYASRLVHGKASEVKLDVDSALFRGMENRIQAARYHSLAAKRESLPTCLRIVADTADGEIMAVEHLNYPVYGLQFHPESILTPDGISIISNFMEVI